MTSLVLNNRAQFFTREQNVSIPFSSYPGLSQVYSTTDPTLYPPAPLVAKVTPTGITGKLQV